MVWRICLSTARPGPTRDSRGRWADSQSPSSCFSLSETTLTNYLLPYLIPAEQEVQCCEIEYYCVYAHPWVQRWYKQHRKCLRHWLLLLMTSKAEQKATNLTGKFLFVFERESSQSLNIDFEFVYI